MNKHDATEYLKRRLALLNNGNKLYWSISDRAAVSALCIDAAQQSFPADRVQVSCRVCGEPRSLGRVASVVKQCRNCWDGTYLIENKDASIEAPRR